MIHKRKGITLAEMSIVMAVIAIVSLSVVSFVTITSGRGTNSIAKLNAMEEIELVEAVVDGWFAQAVQVEEPLNTGGSFDMSGQTLKVIFPGKTEATDYYLEKVTEVSFSQRFLTESGECKETLADGDVVKDTLYFCTVTYVQHNEDVRETYTFCINPRVGETIVPEPTGATTEQEAQ